MTTRIPDTTALADWELSQTAQLLSRLTIDERVRVIRRLHSETGEQPAHIDAVGVVRWLASHSEWSDATICTYSYRRPPRGRSYGQSRDAAHAGS